MRQDKSWFGELSLPGRSVEWLRSIETTVVDLELPDDDSAAEQLIRLGVDASDRLEALGARPSPDASPALWQILQRTYSKLRSDLGRCVPIEGHSSWPIRFTAADGAVARYLPVWLYLAVLPQVRHYHRGRGIADDVGWASLSTPLNSVLRKHRSVTGLGGIGLFGFGTSALLAFRGAQYRLGRLEFSRGEISFSDGPCGFALSVHIPPIRGLTPELSEAAVGQAGRFFAEHFPEEPVTLFSCRSWLLDPQLSEYLPSTSSIVRFQQRFQLLPFLPDQRRQPFDGEVAEYVFGAAVDDLHNVPRQTRLQRAFVEHLLAGRHWYDRTGWVVPETRAGHDRRGVSVRM